MPIDPGAHSINDDGVVFCHDYLRMLNNSPPQMHCVERYKGKSRSPTIEYHHNSNSHPQLPTTNRHSTQTNQPQTFNMLYTTILAFAVAAFAAPLEEKRQVGLCSSGNPVCCATDVLNVADLNCVTRKLSHYPLRSLRPITNSQSAPTTPTDVNSFVDICAAEGQQAKCCLLPILGQALLCSDVNPTAAA